jgi:hypothetical protein
MTWRPFSPFVDDLLCVEIAHAPCGEVVEPGSNIGTQPVELLLA